MKIPTIQKLMIGLSVALLVAISSGCSSKPSPWTKKDSPWGQSGKSLGSDGSAAGGFQDDMAAIDEPTGMDSRFEEPPMAEESMPMDSMEQAPADGDIMTLPASYYAVQVMASVDIDRVYKFAERNQLSVRYVVPTMRDGVTWHVLLLDVYPDYASAKAGVSEMGGLLPTKPWIRKVSSIQRLVP